MGDKLEDPSPEKEKNCVELNAFEKKVFDEIQPKLKLIPGFRRTVIQKLGQVFVVRISVSAPEEARQQIRKILDEHILPSPYTWRIEEV